MKLIIILLIMLVIPVVSIADVNYQYTQSSGKTSTTITESLVTDYLTLDQINKTPLNQDEGYILSLPLCIDKYGDIRQFAVVYGDSFGLVAFTFRDTRGVTGYFKPGDKVKLNMRVDPWLMEKVI